MDPTRFFTRLRRFPALVRRSIPAVAAGLVPTNLWNRFMEAGPIVWLIALIVFVCCFGLIKKAAKFAVRLASIALLAAAMLFAWIWWERSHGDLEDGFAFLKEISRGEFSAPETQRALRSSQEKMDRLLDQARDKGQETYQKALQSATTAIEDEIAEAARKGMEEAKNELLRMKDGVVERVMKNEQTE